MDGTTVQEKNGGNDATENNDHAEQGGQEVTDLAGGQSNQIRVDQIRAC